VKKLNLALVIAIWAMVGTSPWAFAEDWPTRPLKIIVPYPPGGAGDLVPRFIAQKLGGILGQPVIIENKPGASGTIGINAVAQASPDGYTLGAGTPAQVVIGKRLLANMPYDPKTDLVPVALTYETPLVLAVSSTSSIKSVQGLVSLAKAQPGSINIAHPGRGTLQHLVTEMMTHAMNIQVMLIPYKNGPATAEAVIREDVHATWIAPPNAIGFIKAGRLRAISVAGAKRVSMLKEVPTLVEQGWPTLVAQNWNALVAPSETPREILDRLNREVDAILSARENAQALEQMGVVPLGGTIEGALKFFDSEEQKWAVVIDKAAIKPE
jgi:tripartite-type tricarboxylate transporter receptor subunit TctC